MMCCNFSKFLKNIPACRQAIIEKSILDNILQAIYYSLLVSIHIFLNMN